MVGTRFQGCVSFNTQFPSTMRVALGHIVGDFKNNRSMGGCVVQTDWDHTGYSKRLSDKGLQTATRHNPLGTCTALLVYLPEKQIPTPKTPHIDLAVCCLCPLQSSS